MTHSINDEGLFYSLLFKIVVFVLSGSSNVIILHLNIKFGVCIWCEVADEIIMDELVWNKNKTQLIVRKRARSEETINAPNESTSSIDTQAQLITIKFSDIPTFLHNSAFYKALSDGDDPEDVVIPRKFYSANDNVRNFPDFLRLLEVMSYWSVDTFPAGAIHFCQYCNRKKLLRILNNVIDEVSFLLELKEIFCHPADDSLTSAIRRGRTEVVQFLAKRRVNMYKPEFIAFASYLGKLPYVQLLHQKGYFWNDCACVDAAMQGHLDCLRYLNGNGCNWNHDVYIKAASNQHWACFKYAAEKGLPWHVEVAMRLAQWKEANMLQYAIEHGCPVDVTVMQEAVANGDTDSVRILLSVDCPVPVESCLVAAKGGHLECLMILREHGALWDEKATATAASADHLSCLQYLHEQGCPWTEKTTEEAAKYGCLGTLRYAMENGCSYNNDIVATAAGAPSIDCVQYLIEEQGLFMGDNGKAFLAAMYYCKPQTVRYLIDQGCDIQNCSEEAHSIFQQADWSLAYLSTGDKLLLDCQTIALAHNWDISNNGQALLNKIVRVQTILPLCCLYLQAEGYFGYVARNSLGLYRKYRWDIDNEYM